ncbi:ribbon-helix-helix domain-containing protein [Anatilimnocola floriformis]|uniref:ribbon-helix-helix domain-containing protein n=1 Tax=Anatilimnocola floriformis TaxID=2948575 RepID=UPI0020C58BBD|nr:hypothetical protein [Anatilimnocola floriformis]
MTTEIPADLVPFVERLVSERRFFSSGEVLAEGLRLLQSREALRDEVAKGFEQLDAGQRIPAAEVYAQLESRIQQIESGK